MRIRRVLLLSASCLFSIAAMADEGMWTYDNFPAARVKAQFGASIDQSWLDRVRTATVRLAGCTGSFVSSDGLILTNHHCVASCLAEHSSKDRSLLETGFLARGREQEMPCAAQVADVLVEMENVTEKVAAATGSGDDRTANEARNRRMTELEAACEKSSKLKCQTVTLYNGGQYFLYKYRRYTDVRLAFAPEADVAAFGGDPDNFQYPRWCLDMALLRAYADGKPASIAHPLHIDFQGPAEGAAVFVSGHPGSTNRLLTTAQLRFLRDVELPQTLLRSSELRGRYIQFAKSSEGASRIVQEALNSLENTIKVRRKQLDALHDESLWATKQREESALRAGIAASASLKSLGDPWQSIEQALVIERTLATEASFLEGAAGFNSRLYRYARTLVRAAAERGKPNAERLREYTDTALPRLRQTMAAPVPVYPELEQLTLTFGFERMREWLGPDHPQVRALLANTSPDRLAATLIAGSKLEDPAVRLALWDGGQAAVEASTDPMIKLARESDAAARALRKRMEDEVEAPIRRAEEQIARARFTLYGTQVYPDATFTLRLNFGSVQAWTENGVQLSPYTRLGTAFARATGNPPFRIPESFMRVRDQLDMNTPVNLSTTNDIVGGNSGSPLIDAKGDVVGLMFDGNIHSISGAYWFDTEKNRAIAVHPALMHEALTKVYHADALLAELSRR